MRNARFRFSSVANLLQAQPQGISTTGGRAFECRESLTLTTLWIRCHAEKPVLLTGNRQWQSEVKRGRRGRLGLMSFPERRRCPTHIPMVLSSQTEQEQLKQPLVCEVNNSWHASRRGACSWHAQATALGFDCVASFSLSVQSALSVRDARSRSQVCAAVVENHARVHEYAPALPVQTGHERHVLAIVVLVRLVRARCP